MRPLFAALILFSAVWTQSLAQPGREPAPPGAYWQSCQGVSVQGSGADATLVAQCRARDGQWRSTSLRYRQCRYEIESIDGRLSCGGLSEQVVPTPPPAAALPQGNYAQSCRGAISRGFGYEAVLSAQCQTRDGRWRSSSLRFADCRSGIENIDGRLTCDYGGNRPPYGAGYGRYGDGSNGYESSGYGDAITLFDGQNYAGTPFTSDREITNIPRQYNDRALSLRVGRSVWQVCSDSDFRGHCETIDRDVRDLREYGLGRSISSMRPVN